MSEPRIEIDRLDSTVGRTLIDALNEDLFLRYGSHDPGQPPPEELAAPHGVFLVAWNGDEPVGCGGLRRHHDDVGEVKRMYVAPTARRTGVARALLERIEEHAGDLGYARLILETGVQQPEAMALYASRGYEIIEPYGIYHDSEFSRCYAKDLGRPARARR